MAGEHDVGVPSKGGAADEAQRLRDDVLVFPCSSAQQRCWFINSLNPGNPALNIALRWEVTGQLSPAIAEQAFQQIIDRHEVLRSRFYEKDGEALQEVASELTFRLSVVDLSMLPEAEQLREALELGEREAHASFDLSQAPPIRATVLRFAPSHAFLHVTVHQIAFDGWSIRILAHEFGTIAAAIIAKRPHGLPEPPLQYGDYCLWQKEYLSSGLFEAETAFWKDKLGGAPYFEVIPDHEKPPRPTYKGVIIASTMSRDLGEQLEESARRHNLTLFSLGCAVMGATLHRYTGEDDVIFGTQIAGRDDPDLENLIGMFINNLVMRFDASGDPSFEQFLQRVNGVVQDALINQRVPFDKLVEILNPPRDPKRTPLISVNFTVLRDVMDHKSYGDFVLRGQPSLSAGSLYDLIFFMVHWPDGWRMALEYNPDLFERETAEKLLDFLMQTFTFAILRPQEKLSSLIPPIRDRIDPPAGREDLDAIEQTLLRHDDVRQAAVAPTGERMTPYAYVAPRSDLRAPLETLPQKLSAYLNSVLPFGAARPSGISVLLEIPKTPRGANDYKNLPLPPPLAAATPDVARGPGCLIGVEAKLARIWRDLLKVDVVGPNSNFFELGGHSLLTIRLMAKVAAEFGVKPDPVTLFQAPTLREFAARLPELGESEPSARVVMIQPEGRKTPIIAINNSVIYYNLARRLGNDRPFLGIPLIHPDGEEAASNRPLEEIAVDYVHAIREAQPHGPYILCGLCIAAALAYECARQLKAAGESVPLLILSDIWVPGYLRSFPRHRKIAYHLAYWMRSLRHRVSTVVEGKVSLPEMLSSYTIVRKTRLLDFAVSLGIVDGGLLARKVIDRDEWLFLMSLEWARNNYKIQPTSSDVVVLKSEEISVLFADPNMGWTRLVEGRLVIKDVPGWHQDMFQDEGADVIVECLRPILEDVDRRATAEASYAKKAG